MAKVRVKGQRVSWVKTVKSSSYKVWGCHVRRFVYACGGASVFISLPAWEFTDTPRKAQTTVTWKNSRNSTNIPGNLRVQADNTHWHTQTTRDRGVGNGRDTGSGSNCVGLTDIDTSEWYQLTHTDADINSDTMATWVTLIDSAEPSQRAHTIKLNLSPDMWLLISAYCGKGLLSAQPSRTDVLYALALKKHMIFYDLSIAEARLFTECFVLVPVGATVAQEVELVVH